MSNTADSDSDCFEDAVDEFVNTDTKSAKSENTCPANKNDPPKTCDNANCDQVTEKLESQGAAEEFKFSDSDDSDSEAYKKLTAEAEIEENREKLNIQDGANCKSESKVNCDSNSEHVDFPVNSDDSGNKAEEDDSGDEAEEDSGNDKEEQEEHKDEEQVEEEDLEARKQEEELLSEEEKEQRKEESNQIKVKGNTLFKEAEYESAVTTYTEALQLCPLCFSKQRAILYSNRGACHMKQDKYKSSISDCTKAIDLDPTYLRAILRRAEMYEKDEKLDEALADYQKAVELDPANSQARLACMRLPDEIKGRNEKMKEEMMGKLKELGNMVLKPFGLSTDNFKLQQDQNSGSYSVNFQK